MKPILFNTEMVRAILEGRKTVTRRVINRDIADWCDKEKDGTLLSYENSYGDFINPVDLCRYRVGDVLYVRETWRWLPCFKCGRDMWAVPCREGKFNHTYKNTGCYVFKADIHNCDADNLKWKPSIHMPKEAARIFLRVTDVRVERLQDITDETAEAEGCNDYTSTALGFPEIWNSTIKPEQFKYYSWYANPYVWVIEFERVEREEVF